MSRRAEFGIAVALCAAAGALGLISGSRVWLSLQIVRPAPLPAAARSLTGTQVAPLVTALAVVLLAGVVGVLATRRWGRPVVGDFLALAGLGMLSAAIPWLGAVSAATARAAAFDAGLPAGELSVGSGAVGPVAALLAGALGMLAGVLIVVRGRRWAALGARYDAPAARPEPAQADPDAVQRATWEALDRGEDPTRPGWRHRRSAASPAPRPGAERRPGYSGPRARGRAGRGRPAAD